MALKHVMRGAARAVLLPLIVVACSTGMTGMTPANDAGSPETTQTLKQNNELPRVDESYALQELNVRYDGNNYFIQLQGADNGQNTGSGRPTQMSLGFDTHRGQGENLIGNSTVVVVDSINFAYDPMYNTQAKVDLDIEPNFRAANKSVFTVIPSFDPSVNASQLQPFEVRKQHYSGTVVVNFTDMKGHPLRNPRQAASDLVGTTSLGMAISFRQNVGNPYNHQNNFLRQVIKGDGQQRSNYFPEPMTLTGAQYSPGN